MAIRKTSKNMVNSGTSADQLLTLNGSAQLPAVDGSLITGLPDGADTVLRTNLAMNFFGDSVRNNLDAFAMENGWIDQFEDESDVDGVTSSSKIPIVKTDGTSDYLSIASGVIADGKSFTGSILVEFDEDGTLEQIFETTNNRFSVSRNTSNEIRILLKNSAGTTICDIASTNTITASDGISQILFAIDMATTTVQVILKGGSVETNQVTTAVANDTVDMTDTNFFISGDGTTFHKGNLGQAFLISEYLDISVAGNEALFTDSSGNPQDLGSDGSTPTGTQAEIYLNNDVATWQNNLGSGGNFTVTGELVDAGSITVGNSEAQYDSTNDLYEPAYEIIDSYGKENDDAGTFWALQGPDSGGAHHQIGVCRTTASGGEVIHGIAFYADETTDGALGNLSAIITGTTGTIHTDAKSDGDIIATSIPLDVSGFTTSTSMRYFVFPEPVVLAGSTDYFFGLNFSDISTQSITVWGDSSSPDSNSQTAYLTFGNVWTTELAVDVIFQLYGLKNLDVITKGSDDIGNSPSSAPDDGHIEALITEQPAAGNSEWSDTLDTDEAGKQNVSYRQVILASDITNDSERVRLTLTGPAATEACEINNVAIVERSGETSHGVATPAEILFGGASGITIPIGGSIVSDWLNFNLNESKSYLLIADIGSTAGADTVRKITSGGNGFYEQSSTNTYNTASGPTGSLTASSTVIFTKLETETKQTLATDIIMELSRDGGTTWSAATGMTRTATQISGTSYNLISGDVNFTGDPSGTNVKGRIRSVNKDKITIKALAPNWG